MKTLLRLAACTGFAMLTNSAWSADSPLPKPLRKFDADKDGKLTGDELIRARQAHNRGGREPEVREGQWKEILERRKKTWLQQQNGNLDLNKDGNLDDAEKERAEKIWGEIADGLGKLRWEILKKYDKNDDGDLNQTEREASRKESDERRAAIEKQAMESHRANAAKPA
ncbi:MAG: hypothetical protein JWL81_3104 [Verrucomicrobiales bacterium]|nr:hypothetical protein [Verrucomicrobiales bacterium]